MTTGLQFTSFTAEMTSSSIARAKDSLSSWQSTQESRVFGLTGLYGIKACGHISYRDTQWDKKKMLISIPVYRKKRLSPFLYSVFVYSYGGMPR
jgi:hypothetical protein